MGDFIVMDGEGVLKLDGASRERAGHRGRGDKRILNVVDAAHFRLGLILLRRIFYPGMDLFSALMVMIFIMNQCVRSEAGCRVIDAAIIG